MFCDQVSIILKAGDGGDGHVGFRREKYVPHGRPDGGNGGQGGSIILRVDANLNSLIDLRKQKIYKAESGTRGHRFDKAGAKGEDLVLAVPPGTMVYDEKTNDLIVDMVEEGDAFVVVRGGKGGFGNAHFMSSVRQVPDFAELGEPGEEIHVRLEMQMVADVGIIGLPSVGKSTLISRITDAKPKIADYPFTTLVPNLGVVNMERFGGSARQSFVVADVPGLIEGAHLGKGLGGEFLRHVSRSAILVHALDCQSHDMRKDFEVIMNELQQYDPELIKRPMVLVMNKIDSIDEETRELLLAELKDFFKKMKSKVAVFAISAVSGEGLKPFLFHLYEEVMKLKHAKATESRTDAKEGYRVFRPHLDLDKKGFDVEMEERQDARGHRYRHFIVRGKRIEQIVVMSDLTNRSALLRVYDVLEKMDIARRLRALGAQVGDKIQIGYSVIEFRG